MLSMCAVSMPSASEVGTVYCPGEGQRERNDREIDVLRRGSGKGLELTAASLPVGADESWEVLCQWQPGSPGSRR